MYFAIDSVSVSWIRVQFDVFWWKTIVGILSICRQHVTEANLIENIHTMRMGQICLRVQKKKEESLKFIGKTIQWINSL